MNFQFLYWFDSITEPIDLWVANWIPQINYKKLLYSVIQTWVLILKSFHFSVRLIDWFGLSMKLKVSQNGFPMIVINEQKLSSFWERNLWTQKLWIIH